MCKSFYLLFMVLFVFSQVNAQNNTILGTVKDSLGLPIKKASVIVENVTSLKKYATLTDENGKYILKNIPNGSQYIQYTEAEGFENYLSEFFALSNESKTFDIQLIKSKDNILKEVVIQAYGSTTKEKFNGSSSKIDNEQLNKVATSNFEQSLQGNLAGVQINQNAKNPGEDSQIIIRGVGTLTAGTNPLLVVDGVPLSEGSSLSSINTQDIETINVLKDAASSSLYGSRASNGVILIQTKKGKKGKMSINFESYYGIQSRSDNVELTNAYESAIFLTKARDNGYLSVNPNTRFITDDRATRLSKGANLRQLRLNYLDPYLNGEQGLTDINWLDAIYRDAAISNQYLSVAGGSENGNYFVSLGNFNQNGIVIANDFRRYSVNVRINSKISEKFNFGVNANSNFSRANVTGNGSNTGFDDDPVDPVGSFYLMYPFFNVFNVDGTPTVSQQIRANLPEDGALVENPVAKALLSKNIEEKFRAFGSVFLEYKPINGLTLKTILGGDFRNTFLDFFSPSTFGTYRTLVENNIARSFENKITFKNIISENLITYEKKVGNHHFDILGGYSYQREEFEYTRTTATGIVTNNIENIAGGTSFSLLPKRERWVQISYFSRLQYDFKNKYFLSASIRRDGSSRFGKNSKWGVFPSFSLGWIISKESFFPQNNWLTYTKLRASWGKTGNNQIGNYASKSLLYQDNYLNGNNVLNPGYGSQTAPNPDLSWETSNSYNFGLDLNFFNNKISLITEYYITNTKDLLLSVPVPEQSGYSSSLQNIGEIEKKGLEFELKGNGFKVGKLTIDWNANIFTNKNKVIALGPGQTQIIATSSGYPFITKVGGNISDLFGYEIIGVYKTQDELNSNPKLAGSQLGDYIVKDNNGDGIIDADDRVPLGNYNPDFTYGFGANLQYKDFDLSFQFYGIEGRKTYDFITRFLESGEGFVISNTYYNDNYYDPATNPNGFLASPNLGNFSAARRETLNSNRFVQKGDYIKLRSIQIGYSLPKDLISKLNLNKVRIYCSANNLFTISDYRGVNPDDNNTNPLTSGQIRSSVAPPFQLIGGINLQF